jgi:hypothetical protein
MSKLTILSEAQIGASEADAIRIVFAEPDDIPSSVVVHWPPAPTKINPKSFRDTAVVVTRLFADAHIALARIRARRWL